MLKRGVSYFKQGITNRYFASDLEERLHQQSLELLKSLDIKSVDNLKIVDESELEERKAKGENVVSRQLWRQLFTPVTAEEMAANLKALEEAAEDGPYY